MEIEASSPSATDEKNSSNFAGETAREITPRVIREDNYGGLH